MQNRKLIVVGFLAITVIFAATVVDAQDDLLPSWNNGSAKKAILAFVKDVTERGGKNYVPEAERVATFDQDGTLWVEHPVYTQAAFALERLGELAPQHPQWKDQEPFKAVLSDDKEAIAKFSEQDWMRIIAATHAGMTAEQFQIIVREWLAKARDSRYKRPYTELVYQPMLEVMKYLRANGFKTYIVSGGGQEFVRVYSERVYGIPPEQVIGSSILTKYAYQDGKPVLVREPKMFFIDDHGGKPVGINLFIGKQPYAAFGNSGGDQEMLEWTAAAKGPRLAMLVLHDDARREYSYGPAQGLPKTTVGEFSQALYDKARKNGWVVVSMKDDWNALFPFERK